MQSVSSKIWYCWKKLNGAKVLRCTKTAQIRPDVVMHICNLGTVEAEVGGVLMSIEFKCGIRCSESDIALSVTRTTSWHVKRPMHLLGLSFAWCFSRMCSSALVCPWYPEMPEKDIRSPGAGVRDYYWLPNRVCSCVGAHSSTNVGLNMLA
ncbi:hypothetical protein STEG23_015245 [Scotinomys teguina]